MTQLPLVAPPVRSRRRLVVLALLAAAALAALLTRRAPSAPPAPPPPGPDELVCERTEPLPPPPPPPAPYDLIDACLRFLRTTDGPGAIGPYLRDEQVTIATIRRWIEVDGDPAWREDDSHFGAVFWFPLSGEGDAQMPSGLYGGVVLGDPLRFPGRCPLAIMN
jgi:hypothetical protein